jgi:hypothetical protein
MLHTRHVVFGYRVEDIADEEVMVGMALWQKCGLGNGLAIAEIKTR